MKKFIFALLVLVLLGFCLLFSKTLSFFCKNQAKEIGVNANVQYSGANLGFLCENVAKKCIYYEENGEIVGECVFLNLSSLNMLKKMNESGLLSKSLQSVLPSLQNEEDNLQKRIEEQTK